MAETLSGKTVIVISPAKQAFRLVLHKDIPDQPQISWLTLWPAILRGGLKYSFNAEFERK